MGRITGYEKPEKQGKPRSDPFDERYIRTWRDLAAIKDRKRSARKDQTT